MLDSLSFFDKELTLHINSCFSDFFDLFFYMFTSTSVWIPLYVVLACMIFSKQGPRGLVTIFFIAMLILVADQLASGLLKPMVERFRPSHDPVMQYMVHLVNGKRGGLYGFASSHAANTFALTTFLALVVRSRYLSWTMIIWALLNSYSRVYMGLHYVGDIVCGALIGVVAAAVAYELYLRASLRFFVIQHHNKRTMKSGMASMFGKSVPYVVASILVIMIVTLLIVSALMLKYNGVAH